MNLSEMTKDELEEYAREKGIEIDKRKSQLNIIKDIEEAKEPKKVDKVSYDGIEFPRKVYKEGSRYNYLGGAVDCETKIADSVDDMKGWILAPEAI